MNTLIPINEVFATGEIVIIRKHKPAGKKGFLFDDDTWGLIKEFWGFLDFESIQECEVREQYKYINQLRRQVLYYIQQIPFKVYKQKYIDRQFHTPRVIIDENRYRDIFMKTIHYGLSERLSLNLVESTYDTIRERYFLIALVLRDFRIYRLGGTIDNPFSYDRNTLQRYIYFDIYKKYMEKSSEYARKERYIYKRNEGFLRRKYCS